MVALDLSHNGLESLSPGLLDNQISLQILNLQNNQIRELPSSAFR